MNITTTIIIIIIIISAASMLGVYGTVFSESRCGLTAGDIVLDTPRTRGKATRLSYADTYNARKKDIPKYHRMETMTQSVDQLNLRDRSVLTPSPAEASSPYSVIFTRSPTSTFAELCILNRA